jgi:hypothetical protein
VGHTNISKAGITSSNFEALPDVPITSVDVNLPTGPLSVLTTLTATTKLCGSRLFAATTIVAQSGAKIVKNTPVTLTGCGLRIVRHRVKHKRALITIEVAAASRVTVSGAGVRGTSRRLRKAQIFTVSLPLSRSGRARLRRHRHKGIVVKLRVTYAPTSGKHASATVKVRFR